VAGAVDVVGQYLVERGDVDARVSSSARNYASRILRQDTYRKIHTGRCLPACLERAAATRGASFVTLCLVRQETSTRTLHFDKMKLEDDPFARKRMVQI